jgi:hypothetical protein
MEEGYTKDNWFPITNYYNDAYSPLETKDRVTRTTLNTGGELRCSGRVSSSCSISGTRRVNLVTNPVISREDYPFGSLSKLIQHVHHMYYPISCHSVLCRDNMEEGYTKDNWFPITNYVILTNVI